jgi:hypothetical protein
MCGKAGGFRNKSKNEEEKTMTNEIMTNDFFIVVLYYDGKLSVTGNY